ncbi:uncharacterized protein BDZ99DRAFT_458025 [Mytilinidion resinicola]|uniref:Uncharacterized protein n=1 Tax=Mytilinidion resinicola TaxID=574789 RepID=A0A6A6Z4R0_9PEZI|nr:uncharacterized protein BDZ99DRAFT_458025 [Mytilinidion resinicola]KAF2816122.1 hypothetical protein BDZ99DRAFT_458025 [Mytilinidion resinicola]
MEFEAEIVEMIENVGFPKKLCEDVAGDIEEIDSDSDSDDDEEDPNEGQVQYQAQDDDDAYEEPYVFKYWAEEDEEEQE